MADLGEAHLPVHLRVPAAGDVEVQPLVALFEGIHAQRIVRLPAFEQRGEGRDPGRLAGGLGEPSSLFDRVAADRLAEDPAGGLLAQLLHHLLVDRLDDVGFDAAKLDDRKGLHGEAPGAVEAEQTSHPPGRKSSRAARGRAISRRGSGSRGRTRFRRIGAASTRTSRERRVLRTRVFRPRMGGKTAADRCGRDTSVPSRKGDGPRCPGRGSVNVKRPCAGAAPRAAGREPGAGRRGPPERSAAPRRARREGGTR